MTLSLTRGALESEADLVGTAPDVGGFAEAGGGRVPAVAAAGRGEALMDVYAAARRFVAMQSRADSAARPATLADAIERDFLLFDLHEAGRDLRDAVDGADEMFAASAARGAARVGGAVGRWGAAEPFRDAGSPFRRAG